MNCSLWEESFFRFQEPEAEMPSSGDVPPTFLPYSASFSSKHCSSLESRAWSEQGRAARPAHPSALVAGTTPSPLRASKGKTARVAGDAGLPGDPGEQGRAFALLFVLLPVGHSLTHMRL